MGCIGTGLSFGYNAEFTGDDDALRLWELCCDYVFPAGGCDCAESIGEY